MTLTAPPWGADSTAARVDQHADYEASWTFDCQAPGALKFVDVQLARELMPGTVVRVSVVGEQIQTQVDITAAAVRVKLQ
jgi:hypothetical protein